jgi:hypothetical protein
MLARIVCHPGAFCFAVTETGDRVFVHKSACDFRLDEARQGDFIDIGSVFGNQAANVTWLERPHAEHPKKPRPRLATLGDFRR